MNYKGGILLSRAAVKSKESGTGPPVRGEYVSTAAKIGKETAAHLGLEGAAASGALKRAIRTRFDIPMDVTARVLDRVTIALLLYSGYEGLKAAQDEYKACMAYMNH